MRVAMETEYVLVCREHHPPRRQIDPYHHPLFIANPAQVVFLGSWERKLRKGEPHSTALMAIKISHHPHPLWCLRALLNHVL